MPHWPATRAQAQDTTLVPNILLATSTNTPCSKHQSLVLKSTRDLVVNPPSPLTLMSPAPQPPFTPWHAGWRPQRRGLPVNTSTWRLTPFTAWATRKELMGECTIVQDCTAPAQVRLQAGTARPQVKLASLQSMQATL